MLTAGKYKHNTVCVRVCVCVHLLAISQVAGQQQDLRGWEGGGQGEAVLLLSDLLAGSVDPLLHTHTHTQDSESETARVRQWE